jgi:hypothetical protein
MAESLNLEPAVSWAAPYQVLKQANPYGSSGLFFPIPTFQIPIQFESPILAISAENQDALSHWRLGVRVRQLFTADIAPLEVTSNQQAVLLNRGPSLIQFPNHAQQYRLEVEVPRWHKEISLSIWEYIGPVVDSTELLLTETTDLIRIDLLRIESKIDAL